jgi:IS30 family transposase
VLVSQDIKSHCSKHRQCALKNASNYGTTAIPLQRYSETNVPWEWIHVDLMVDLPKTDEGYIHILVIKERLTQWVELIPLHTKTAMEVAQAFFENVYCRHGAVKHIVSDNGKK